MGRADAKPDEAIAVTAGTTATSGPLQSGKLLAERYLVGVELGRGVAGVVYRAFDQRAGVAVALKALYPQRWPEPQAAEQLYRELRFGRSLHHPNVCRLHDVLAADGRFYLVMELASGGTLRTSLADTTCPPGAGLADARAVIAGLAAIHGAGLVHRDLKPENVLRLDDGRLVISDFGLARALEQATATTTGLGTPGYLAPEILAGARADQASDVWSLGVVLHEILAGCRPRWAGDRVRSNLPAVAGADRERLALTRLCEACLQPDRRRRPATGGQADAFLTTALRAERARGRQRRAILGEASLLAALAIAGLLLGVRPQRAPAPAAQAADHGGPVPGQDWSAAPTVFRPPWRETISCWQPVGPEGRIVRFAHQLAPPATVVDLDVRTGQQQPAPTDPEAYLVGCPSLSPDGGALLFARRRGAATEVVHSPRADGRDAVPVLPGSHPVWLQGGKAFLFVTPGQDVALGELDGRSRTLARSGPAAGTILQVAVDDRDESAAALVRDGAGGRLDLYDLRARRLVRRHELPAAPGGRLAFDGRRGAFQVPSVAAGVPVLAELSEAGTLLPRGHVPGMSVQGATRLPGGLLIATLRETGGRSFRIGGPEGTQPLVTSGQLVGADTAVDGSVLFMEHAGPSTSDLLRLVIWRPGPPSRRQVLAEAGGIGQPVLAIDGRSAVYHRLGERDFYHCDLSRPGAADPCRLVHVDPGLHGVPVPGPLGPDGETFPYYAMVPAPGGDGARQKVLRILFVRSGGVLELGPVEATCRVLWTTPRTFWLLRDDDPLWREIDMWTGKPTSRTFASDPVAPCYALPPGHNSPYRIRKESPWELRWLPEE